MNFGSKGQYMQLGDLVYHPCSMDILKFKVIGILTYEDRVMYHIKAVENVGACGNIEVLIVADKHNILHYAGLYEEYEYEQGLDDFVKGVYYTNKTKAKIAYYEQQRILVWSKMEEHKRRYEDSKKQYEKVLNIIKVAKDDLKENE